VKALCNSPILKQTVQNFSCSIYGICEGRGLVENVIWGEGLVENVIWRRDWLKMSYGGGGWLKTSYGGLAENIRIPSYGGR